MIGQVTDILARMILDSRGRPTIEVDCFVDGRFSARAAVPSGASTGSHEAVELRDGGPMWLGSGVQRSVDNVNTILRNELIGMSVHDQTMIDERLISADGTPNKSLLGANSILGCSLAILRASANEKGIPLWKSIPGDWPVGVMPVPLMNILNGGAHAATNVDVQEFMVVPYGFPDFTSALRAGTETYHALKNALEEKGLLSGIGDEGGFAPSLERIEEGLELLVEAIERAGYSSSTQIGIALDVAATEFYDSGGYSFDGKMIGGSELSSLYSSWIEKYPIVSIEDPFSEDDWGSWISFTEKGHDVLVIGDDLYVTNKLRLEKGVFDRASNSILIKPNQIGTVSETLEVMQIARSAGFDCIMSHRSGETCDSSISDLAVGTGCGWIKTGAPARSDRTSKYNQLIRIEEQGLQYQGRLV
ncbi:MAG: phosphopyruvate hydratase [Candidatus Thermoplasmatota archaeon]|nr:phosphopyruvate hydratase [Candidatus Thermoplasmatota archaeon]